MKNIIRLLILICVFIVSLFIYLHFSAKSNYNNEDLALKHKAIGNGLIHKQINALKYLIGLEKKPRVLFYYTGDDCNYCIGKGFEISKRIDSSLNRDSVFVFGLNTNYGMDQTRYSYFNYIFDDKKDLIRKELKYIYTPLIIALDENSRIRSVLFPSKNTNDEEYNKFFKEVLELFKQPILQTPIHSGYFFREKYTSKKIHLA